MPSVACRNPCLLGMTDIFHRERPTVNIRTACGESFTSHFDTSDTENDTYHLDGSFDETRATTDAGTERSGSLTVHEEGEMSWVEDTSWDGCNHSGSSILARLTASRRRARWGLAANVVAHACGLRLNEAKNPACTCYQRDCTRWDVYVFAHGPDGCPIWAVKYVSGTTHSTGDQGWTYDWDGTWYQPAGGALSILGGRAADACEFLGLLE